jgi:hypothetical protein
LIHGILHVHKKSPLRTLWKIRPLSSIKSSRKLLMKYSWVNRAPEGTAFRLTSFAPLKKIVKITFWAPIAAFFLKSLHLRSLQTHDHNDV